MLYSHSSELAIRAALFLALQPPGKLSTVEEIATGTQLPKSYLAKIIGKLACAGLVRAFRGPGGGIELGRAPEAISLLSVVRAMEGPAPPEWCVLGARACSDEKPCSLHHEWVPLRDKMHHLLDQTTLASLTREFHGRTTPHERSSVIPRGGHPGGPSWTGEKRPRGRCNARARN